MNVCRDFGQILFVVPRQDYRLVARPVGCQELLFDPTDGQHLAAQGNLAGHSDVALHGNLGQRAHHCGGQRDTRRRAVLGDRTLRDVDVDIDMPVEVRAQSQPRRPRPDVADGGLPRLLHYVAEFSGEQKLALARHDGGFDIEDLAAHLGPRESRGQPDFALLLRLRIPELDDAEVLLEVVRPDG